MEIPLPELADRLTILKLKRALGNLDVKEELIAYWTALMSAAGRLGLTYTEVQDALDGLFVVNQSIWDLEFDLRRGREGTLGLLEVARRALLIRDKNRERIKLKNSLAVRTGEGFPELKTDHASAL